MTIQYSVAVRNSQLDSLETAVGTSAILRIFTGAPPANVAAASTGTVLATMNLPADWMNAASGGTKTKLGTWQDTGADASGTAGYFRIFASDGTTAHIQGTITITGGGGDMILDNTNIAAGQSITVSTFSITAGNA